MALPCTPTTRKSEEDFSQDLIQKYESSDERPPTVVDRYFKKKYGVKVRRAQESNAYGYVKPFGFLDQTQSESVNGLLNHFLDVNPTLTGMQKKEGEDICILIHSNRICIVTLAPSHPILEKMKKVTGVNFNVGKVNRLDNKVSGKGKRGAQWLGPSSTLCSLSCEDGSIYDVCSGIKGQLIEVNEALIHSPHLINEEPLNTGFIGILLPPLKEHQQETERLLTEDQYQEVLRERQSACT